MCELSIKIKEMLKKEGLDENSILFFTEKEISDFFPIISDRIKIRMYIKELQVASILINLSKGENNIICKKCPYCKKKLPIIHLN